MTDPLAPPEPLGTLRPLRSERQRWERRGAAWGEIDLGYDGEGRVVRVGYRWFRRLLLAGGGIEEVTTAELWALGRDGAWRYAIRPGGDGFRAVPHGPLRRLLRAHLNVDIGPGGPERPSPPPARPDDGRVRSAGVVPFPTPYPRQDS
ncbi:MAG: hypothetical protein KDG89_17330 [Geminicoccaceae bacterium]|nr:hypothetical protein [Geminicoccaceae bacterium]